MAAEEIFLAVIVAVVVAAVVVAIAREQCDPDAHADPQLVTLDGKAAGQRRLEPICQSFRGRRLSSFHDQAELVTSKPGEEGLGCSLHQSVRDLAQHLVTDRLAEHVVDFFETIEAEAEDADLSPACPRPRERGSQVLVKCGAIGQPDELVR